MIIGTRWDRGLTRHFKAENWRLFKKLQNVEWIDDSTTGIPTAAAAGNEPEDMFGYARYIKIKSISKVFKSLRYVFVIFSYYSFQKSITANPKLANGLIWNIKRRNNVLPVICASWNQKMTLDAQGKNSWDILYIVGMRSRWNTTWIKKQGKVATFQELKPK